MQRITALSIAGLITVLGVVTPTAHAEVTRKATPRTALSAKPEVANPSGLYSSAESNVRIAVRPDGIGEVESSAGWNAVGFFSGREFVGLLRDIDDRGNPIPLAEYGSIRFELRGDGSIDAELAPRGGTLRQEEHWRPRPREVNDPPKRPEVRVTPPPAEEPKFGEYVYVEELPEAIEKVSPVYPPGMRSRGIEGTVLVQVRVSKDGLVTDTRVVKSIRDDGTTREFDAAAIESVRQWKFKPARSKDAPVAVWVAVPVRFSLH